MLFNPYPSVLLRAAVVTPLSSVAVARSPPSPVVTSGLPDVSTPASPASAVRRPKSQHNFYLAPIEDHTLTAANDNQQSSFVVFDEPLTLYTSDLKERV